MIWFIFWVMMVPAFFSIANEDEAAGVSAIFGVFTTMMFLIISLAATIYPARQAAGMTPVDAIRYE